MDETIPFGRIRDALMRAADEVSKNRQYYNDLDSPIGDSDHGDSVCEAFKLVKDVAARSPDGKEDIGELFQVIGKAITFSGGAAMGPLYGTAFMEAGKAVATLTSLSFKDLVKLWSAFAEGIARRGGVKRGEKTMYDTVRPAVDALESAFAAGTTLADACRLVVTAAEAGMSSTRDMLSLRGRSSRLGERSLGHIDPGSASMFTVLSAFFNVIAG
jgi:phosphoenolpyruvate---glycerone phosphotransferase subunit DhaL